MASSALNFADDCSFNVGQSAVDAVVEHGEAFVVDAQEVQDGGMHVVAGGRMLAVGRLVAPFVAGPECCSTANPAPGEPIGEDERIVVAPPAPLSAGHPPELRRPMDQ